MTATRVLDRGMIQCGPYVFPQTYVLAIDTQRCVCCTTMTTPSLSDTSTSDTYVPYVRRRNTPAQLTALHRLFEVTPHPTRAQRHALANEIDMYVILPPPVVFI